MAEVSVAKMRMRILHLESESGYSEIAEKELRQASNDIVYRSVQTREECTQALSSAEFDILLTASSFAPLTWLSDQYPYIPLIVWATTEGERRSFQTSNSGIWDVLLRSESERLPTVVGMAVQHAALRTSHTA